jgi:hypothetical protein
MIIERVCLARAAEAELDLKSGDVAFGDAVAQGD